MAPKQFPRSLCWRTLSDQDTTSSVPIEGRGVGEPRGLIHRQVGAGHRTNAEPAAGLNPRPTDYRTADPDNSGYIHIMRCATIAFALPANLADSVDSQCFAVIIGE
jgi:hypothetical protein